ncbi:MAG: ATP-binding protein [Rickettsiales bacterium]|nr:ATP-binding protein [Rickettsiales bacterium]
MDKLTDILYKWNNWQDSKLNGGFKRAVSDEIFPLHKTEDIITLIGPRRAGKTTILYQIINKLEQIKDKKSILHINFEEPFFATELNLKLLDKIYEHYRNNIFPEGKAYLFLDEIQNIPQWERWVRARNESENIKIFITGSSAKLLSRELGTLLTGRHLSFSIYPLSFKEILEFRKITIPNNLATLSPPPRIANALLEYLKWGGFPRIVLEENENIKLELLKQYFDDILYKDIIMRHQIRDVTMLRELAAHLITNTASLTSTKRLANIFGVSQSAISSYQDYLEEGFLLNGLPFFSLKQAERNRHPRKIYCMDLGLRMAVNNSNSPDNGKVLETLINNVLMERCEGNVFYWQKTGEVDFLTRDNFKIKNAYQVVHKGLDDPKTFKRKISSLIEASEHFEDIDLKLICSQIPEGLETDPRIKLIPLWHFLLNEDY